MDVPAIANIIQDDPGRFKHFKVSNTDYHGLSTDLLVQGMVRECVTEALHVA